MELARNVAALGLLHLHQPAGKKLQALGGLASLFKEPGILQCDSRLVGKRTQPLSVRPHKAARRDANHGEKTNRLSTHTNGHAGVRTLAFHPWHMDPTRVAAYVGDDHRLARLDHLLQVARARHRESDIGQVHNAESLTPLKGVLGIAAPTGKVSTVTLDE